MDVITIHGVNMSLKWIPVSTPPPHDSYKMVVIDMQFSGLIRRVHLFPALAQDGILFSFWTEGMGSEKQGWHQVTKEDFTHYAYINLPEEN
jgi:hypothetical protein